jgi:hypothetical protein
MLRCCLDEITISSLPLSSAGSVTRPSPARPADPAAIRLLRAAATALHRLRQRPELAANARATGRVSGAGSGCIKPGSPGRTLRRAPRRAAAGRDCSPTRRPAAYSKPRCWSRTGGSRTTPSDPPHPWRRPDQPAAPAPGPPTTGHADRGWTNSPDPVTAILLALSAIDARSARHPGHGRSSGVRWPMAATSCRSGLTGLVRSVGAEEAWLIYGTATVRCVRRCSCCLRCP